jgi:two-component sensor histidine kinase
MRRGVPGVGTERLRHLSCGQLRDSEQRHLALSQRLEEALQRRELLLREADHRIKNSLQLVISLLSLKMLKLTDPDAREALEAAGRPHGR